MTGSKILWLLLRLHGRMLRRKLVAIRHESSLMVTVITLFVAAYWVGGYYGFRAGLDLLAKVPGLQVVLLDRMLYVFFGFLFVMLAFSNMVIGFSALFKNDETEWLLTLPVRAVDVFRWKVLETAALASWAFLFLSGPLMLAYGVTKHVSPWFYVKAALLFVPFIVIPAALGALVILVVTRYLHRQVFKLAIFGLGGLLVAGALVFVKPFDAAGLNQTQMVAVLNRLMQNSQLALQPLLPSYWVASGVIAWGEDWGRRGGFFFLVLLSNALLAGLVCLAAGRRWFYEGWSRSHSQGDWQSGIAWLDWRVNLPRVGLAERIINAVPGLPPAMAALVLKDARMFWRDTAQWSQFVIFFGLLGMYVVNLRHVAYDGYDEAWRTFVSFLNLGAASLTLATLTTRFVFPQFSMEGRRLWLLGVAPCGLRRVLLEKLWLSSLVAMAITVTLMITSSRLLRLPAWQVLFFSGTVILMSFALSGIAVGVGALFPNMGRGSAANRTEDNPAKIVSGFGGTLCFVLSLLYLVAVIGIEVLAVHAPLRWVGLDDGLRPVVLVAGWFVVSLLSLLVTVIPMQLALRRVESLEI
jgi:ABC-2 type transport system permease protein